MLESTTITDDALITSGVPTNTIIMRALARDAARSAVRDTFFILGVDLTQPGEVDLMRRYYQSSRDKMMRSEKRRETWSKGMVHGFISILVVTIGAALTYFSRGNASVHN